LVSLPSFLPFLLPPSLWAFECVIFGDVASQSIKKNSWILTAEGVSYAERGSPEFQVFEAVRKEGGSKSRVELEVQSFCSPCLFDWLAEGRRIL
jgi:hypothetical protein